MQTNRVKKSSVPNFSDHCNKTNETLIVVIKKNYFCQSAKTGKNWQEFDMTRMFHTESEQNSSVSCRREEHEIFVVEYSSGNNTKASSLATKLTQRESGATQQKKQNNEDTKG